MITTFIELGGVKRPIRFGFEGLYAYEQKTGRKALSDFAQLSDNPEEISVTLMTNLIYSGLYAGYRKEEIPIDFDEYTVASWIGETPGAIETVFAAFTASFPEGKKTTPQAKKAKVTT